MAQIQQVFDEMGRQTARCQPAHHLGIEQIPATQRQDPGTDLGADFQHALGRQGLDRFAQDGAADAQLLAEIRLYLEGATGWKLPGREALAELFYGRGMVAAGHEGIPRVGSCPQ